MQSASGSSPTVPRFGQERVTAVQTAPFTVRFGWGESGAAALGTGSDVVVVVDVITFTTAVTVAVDRGCAVYPHRWDDRQAGEMARDLGAELAVSRSQVDATHPYSLSPATLSRLPRGSAIVLPSPNGSAISKAVSQSGAVVVAGSLRNAAAVARYARRAGRIISVIAAGERWPDQTLDPALEDLIGAGAIIDGLRSRRRSPEARAAACAYRDARRIGLRRALFESTSAREQRRRGYPDEFEWASALNVSTCVPVLRDGAFRSLPGPVRGVAAPAPADVDR
ncbi:MAG: 2-phosphosulfolactate phosphatase [Candidatus Dormibacteraeota bacterium]|jgi:2-phosphosulfolactate phosphatase|nr:2-phosphosulfolactate phosphatase [Candidatus Dormibacteraeota bacterium]